MRKTLCTYAVGKGKYRVMAIAMMQTARETSDVSIDRYVIFTDTLRWAAVPEWIELVLLDSNNSQDRDSNWALKPELLLHPAVKKDLLLYLDSDSTIYSNSIGKCFDWIEQNSILVFMHFLPADQGWGQLNLGQVYTGAGFDARNLSINAGILGRKPDALGHAFQQKYSQWMKAQVLSSQFSTSMDKKNDEPYAGLAYQQAFRDLGQPVREQAHPLVAEDYMLTIGACIKQFSVKPGPVIRVPWCSHDVVRPAIVHWIDCTQYFFYRRTLWECISRARVLRAYFLTMVASEIELHWGRARQVLLRFVGK